MRGRATLLLGVLLVALMAAPQFTAAPGGIGAAGDQGCTCHGGASPDTTVIVDGLPTTYNASETYTFTVTVQNDVMEINEVDWNGRAGGFRILVSHGDIVAVPDSLSQMMDGGLTHTDEANTVRSWTFEWTAPAADDLNVEMTIYGNAVNGGNGAGGDHWNVATASIAGINAGAVAPSASALVIFVTSIDWTRSRTHLHGHPLGVLPTLA
ncbi:MAG: choice-of-anchor V domain-containing protein [Poseidonia sp.]